MVGARTIRGPQADRMPEIADCPRENYMPSGRLLLNARVFWELRRLDAASRRDAKQRKVLQFQRLKRLLVYAFDTFPFHRERMADAGFEPRRMKCVEQIQRIPVMDKQAYRDFTDSLVDREPNKYRQYYQDGTSGSTGTPLKVYRTWDERAYMLAKYLRSLFANGYRITDKTFCLPSPHRLVKRDSFLQSLGVMRRYSVAYTEPVQRMVDAYRRVNPDFLYANKSQLVQMALYIKDAGITIQKPRIYLSTAETLDGNSRKLIHEVFGRNNLFQVYGAVEMSTLAVQHATEDIFHFYHDTNVLELDDNGRINQDRGECIITDLKIYSMPLIRYRLGDWLETSEQNGLRVITAIRGRQDDWVLLRNGARKPFHAFYEIMERRTEVLQFRVIQETPDLIRILTVLAPGTNSKRVERLIVHDMQVEVANDVTYEVVIVDSIPPDPNGKLRMIVSKVASGAC